MYFVPCHEGLDSKNFSRAMVNPWQYHILTCYVQMNEHNSRVGYKDTQSCMQPGISWKHNVRSKF